ncbi:hypothetical protein MYP_4807 [Sporocytophaga myxococcoides]|uniref:PorZ N-terminal beta-propeller domain-containing protein n=1 Tax=Sporocytophaga myxococcoides TaxID=153721 RepID=A0A098LMF9_9BACT|nr:two-component regulator propeller domain-containing protein [Sporocytophaga myxococcoides]GAL87577.1 hypothetical protein MYP_4807 [Sporocytophaga myxococcoides]
MKSRFILLIFLCLLIQTGKSHAQSSIPLGSWRTHLPYNYWTGVTVAGNKVYATATPRSLAVVDQTDNSISPLSKIDGLTGVDYTSIKHNDYTGQTVITYADANIDIIEKDGSIYNLSELKNKTIIGSKAINHINFNNEFAYLSTDFGLIIINLKKKEVKESYTNIGPNGSTLKVYTSSLNQNKDSLYAATDKGLMVGRISTTINLLDYSNWYIFQTQDGIPSSIRTINYLNGIMIAGTSNGDFYYYTDQKWQKTDLPSYNRELSTVNLSGNKLLCCMNDYLLIVENLGSYEVKTGSPYNFPKEASFDKAGNLWVADQEGGGLFKVSNGTIQSFQINSPLSENAFKVDAYGDKIVVCGGGYNSSYLKADIAGQYNIFENNTWTSSGNISNVADIIHSTYNPFNGKLYFASYGNGILEVKNNQTTIYNPTNTPIIDPWGGHSSFVLTTDAKVDKNGTLWILNSFLPSSTSFALHALSKDSVWKNYIIPLDDITHNIELLIDSYNQKWIRMNQNKFKGLIIFNEKTNKYRYLDNTPGKGGLPQNIITSMAEDKKGDMWIGTTEGIGIIYNASSVLTSATVDAVKPIYEGYPLLYQETINCIKVDGGNRKWIGTENGLWLLSETGLEVIHHFTVDNSPLLSNIINDVAIMENTGEVFIATSKGLISFRGESSEGTDQFKDVKIFPNPIPPGFSGTVGISGLAKNANVKITDIYGNLIFQTKAAGGTATWNGKNYNGKKAETGTYLVFSSSENGEESMVAKIAVIE